MSQFQPGPTRSLPLAFFRETEKNNIRMRRMGDSFQSLPLGQLENDSRLYIQVKNTTSLPCRRYAIMALGELVFDEKEAMDDPMFELVDPSPHPLTTPVVVCEAIPAGKTGKAILRGATPALVTHTAGDDHVKLADPDGGATEHAAQDSTSDPTRIEILHAATDLSMVLLKSYTGGWVFKSPPGGIPARSGIACGSADCDAYWIDDDGDLVELQVDGTTIKRKCWNIAEEGVAGNRYIQAKPAHNKLLTDVEYCPAS